MDGVYTLWSLPRPRRRPHLPPLERLLLAVSVLQWRALHGRALLYCDSAYASYLQRGGLLDLFDNVDTDTVDAAHELDLNPVTFWSLARLLALQAATAPFVALDCDMILWRDLTWFFDPARIVVTHWESTENSRWYPDPRELSTPPGYRWEPWKLATTPAANVSLLYIGDMQTREDYIAEALHFAIGNPARARPDLGAAPELLFAEQRMLPLVAQRRGLTVTPLIEAVWSPESDRFTKHDPRFGEWDPLRIDGQAAGITHGWFHKTMLSAGDPRRHRLITELANTLRRTKPALLAKIGAGER